SITSRSLVPPHRWQVQASGPRALSPPLGRRDRQGHAGSCGSWRYRTQGSADLVNATPAAAVGEVPLRSRYGAHRTALQRSPYPLFLPEIPADLEGDAEAAFDLQLAHHVGHGRVEVALHDLAQIVGGEAQRGLRLAVAGADGGGRHGAVPEDGAALLELD